MCLALAFACFALAVGAAIGALAGAAAGALVWAAAGVEMTAKGIARTAALARIERNFFIGGSRYVELLTFAPLSRLPKLLTTTTCTFVDG